MSMRIADGLMNFKCRLHFYILIWFICAVHCKTWSALHAIRGFRMQRDPKGNRLPFATAHKDISVPFASCRKVSDSRMQYIFIFADFFDLHAVSNTFWLFAKRRQTTFRTETKGNPVTISNNVTQVSPFYSYIKQFFTCKFICEICQRNYVS